MTQIMDILYGEHYRQQHFELPELPPQIPEGTQRLKRGLEIPSNLYYSKDSLLVVGGLPGAGKSTFIARACLNCEVLSVEKNFPKSSKGKPTLDELSGAFAQMLTQIEDVPKGIPVVAETTALNHSLRNALIHSAEQCGRRPHLLMIDAQFKQAAEGLKQRGSKLPAAAWERYKEHMKMFRKTLEVLPNYLNTPEGWESAIVASRWATNKIDMVQFI